MGNQDDPNPRIEALGYNILKDRGYYPDISDPSNPDGVSTLLIAVICGSIRGKS